MRQVGTTETTAVDVSRVRKRHQNCPYGEVKLNMTRRITLNVAQTAETDAEPS
jgi:hypothetical protein